MSYVIEFRGGLNFNKPLTKELKTFIRKFSATRRVERDIEMIKDIYSNWEDECFFGDLGPDGEYFVGGAGLYGQLRDSSILNYNASYPQPSLWCSWTIGPDDTLVWDKGNNFYEYEKWLNYLIDHFFSPLGYVLNGEITFQGEHSLDKGTISVVNNNVQVDSYVK